MTVGKKMDRESYGHFEASDEHFLRLEYKVKIIAYYLNN